MVMNLGEKLDKKLAGGKAATLSEIKKLGLPVPAGFVLQSGLFWETLAPKKEEILAALHSEETDTTQKSSILQALVQSCRLPARAYLALQKRMANGGLYAVRSSGNLEDTAALSFAGQYQTTLNVANAKEAQAAVLACYASVYSPEVLAYMQANGLAAEDVEMAVLVQQMVPAETSGVVFTLNPLTGADHEMVIETAAGLGDNLVSGRTNAQLTRYNWLAKEVTEQPTPALLTTQELENLCRTALATQVYFGYPCDIEFAFAAGKLYILQARPITRVLHTGLADVWTTADFKDGGVSATVCMPFMWSLYEYAWDNAFKRFLLRGRILPPKQLRKPSRLFYGRPYWNLSIAKEALSGIPGYKEREFDSEYGIQGSYEGDGAVTKITPKTLVRIARIALAQRKILKERTQNSERLREDLLARFYRYKMGLSKQYTRPQLEKLCKKLIRQDYLKSESTYFNQIFINTVHQALYKSAILKQVDAAGYFALIGGLEKISHLLPFYEMWKITRAIRQNQEARRWWEETAGAEIAAQALAGGAQYCLPQFAKFIDKYAYHSEKELDITYPCYDEVPADVAEMFRQTLQLDDACAPALDAARQQALYQNELAALRGRVGRAKYKKLAAKTERMRTLLWWREEYRDVSTRFYYLVRKYMLKLAAVYKQEGILRDEEDIWYLKITDLLAFIDGKTGADGLQAVIARNRIYYNAYRNYTNENEIGENFAPLAPAAKGAGTLQGLGCTTGTVEGTARVVAGLEEMDALQPGDILVTKFTDTGWTRKFAMLSGVVTEYGGVLCHAAIVSREYGIPCVVCAQGATQTIPNGARVRVNGATGEITILTGQG